MNNVIANFGAQAFVQKSAKIARVSKFTNTAANSDGEFESRVTYWVQLADGHALPVSLDNLSRAVGRNLDDRSLVLIHGGEISYIESERKAGLPFKWRHTDPDSAALVATKDATFVTVESVEPLDSRFAYIMDLPIYEVRKSAVVAEPQHNAADDNEPELPAGATKVEETADAAASEAAAVPAGENAANARKGK